jgi:hypothetical protein
MSNRAIKGFIVLVLFFFLLSAIVLGVLVFSQPFVRLQMGIPDSGGAINSGVHPAPSITPTRHVIPPLSGDVRGLSPINP